MTQVQLPIGAATRSFLAEKPRMLIGKNWVPARSGQSLPVIDPATELHVADLAAADAADVEWAVSVARASA